MLGDDSDVTPVNAVQFKQTCALRESLNIIWEKKECYVYCYVEIKSFISVCQAWKSTHIIII